MSERHISEEEAEAIVRGEPFPEWADCHLRAWTSERTCTCHRQLFLALDAYLRRAEEQGEAVAARQHLEGRLSDLLEASHLCPEDLLEPWIGETDPQGLREATGRHVRFCKECNRQLRDLLGTLGLPPGLYEPVPDLVPE